MQCLAPTFCLCSSLPAQMDSYCVEMLCQTPGQRVSHVMWLGCHIYLSSAPCRVAMSFFPGCTW